LASRPQSRPQIFHCPRQKMNTQSFPRPCISFCKTTQTKKTAFLAKSHMDTALRIWHQFPLIGRCTPPRCCDQRVMQTAVSARVCICLMANMRSTELRERRGRMWDPRTLGGAVSSAALSSDRSDRRTQARFDLHLASATSPRHLTLCLSAQDPTQTNRHSMVYGTNRIPCPSLAGYA
jgi:hypothetical protein